MIAIKDMKMPKSCFMCKFREIVNKNLITCNINDKDVTWQFIRCKRAKDCPLVEVK